MRQLRLRGFAQIFLAAFALLATVVPGTDGLPLGDGHEQIVSVPADSRGDASLVRATLALEDLEEEIDEDEAWLVLAFADTGPPGHAVYGATDAFIPHRYRLAAYLGTGPPRL